MVSETRWSQKLIAPPATSQGAPEHLFYALRRLGLDVADDARPPQEQHVVLVNRKEIEATRMRVALA